MSYSDYIQYSVRDFVTKTLKCYGQTTAQWSGSGLTERCYDSLSGKVFVETNEKYYRPADVHTLVGDSTKARRVLNWQPKYDLDALVADMCINDIKRK